MNPDDIDTSKPLPDDYELDSDQLREIAEGFGLGYPDENLLSDIKHGAAHWQLPAPKWTRIKTGSFELKTPYGLLTAERLFGWVVRRDGALLVWRCNGQRPVMFGKLEDAQTSAVLHARDGQVGFADGTRWAQ